MRADETAWRISIPAGSARLYKEGGGEGGSKNEKIIGFRS